MLVLTTWSNFYVIIGSSAGTLTGLTFVAITLVAGRREGIRLEGLNAFTTPIVVHFAVALLTAAFLSAPWTALGPVALVLGLVSLFGLAYSAMVVRRIRGRFDYRAEWDDWLWYAVLPLSTYTVLLVSAILLPSHPTPALFVTAAGLMLLLFIGIRNAWDIVTYVALEILRQGRTESEQQTPGDEPA
jgi:hypothetical protein